MKALAMLMLTLAMVGGAATAYAGDADDCHTLSDSVYGVWGCR